MQSADHSSPSSSSPSCPKTPITSPCASCKILRRRCSKQCILAPYFPPSEPQKFIMAHRVFGASNIVKLIQEVPEPQREDAASSLVYEANARSRNPVYGCAGAIFQLQKELSELQSQLAAANAKIQNMRNQQAQLAALLRMEMTQSREPMSQLSEMFAPENKVASQPQLQLQQGNFAGANHGSLLDPLWT